MQEAHLPSDLRKRLIATKLPLALQSVSSIIKAFNPPKISLFNNTSLRFAPLSRVHCYAPAFSTVVIIVTACFLIQIHSFSFVSRLLLGHALYSSVCYDLGRTLDQSILSERTWAFSSWISTLDHSLCWKAFGPSFGLSKMNKNRQGLNLQEFTISYNPNGWRPGITQANKFWNIAQIKLFVYSEEVQGVNTLWAWWGGLTV